MKKREEELEPEARINDNEWVIDPELKNPFVIPGIRNIKIESHLNTNYSFEKTFGGNPWSDTEVMQKNNPMSYAKNFKTPMLLTHGELDYRVPYVNSTALYGVLQGMKVPSRLVIFPNENHWILSPQNSVYWYWEVQSWLQRYIGGTPTLVQPKF